MPKQYFLIAFFDECYYVFLQSLFIYNKINFSNASVFSFFFADVQVLCQNKISETIIQIGKYLIKE